MTTSPEILAAQAEYWARPFAVIWRDSHFSCTQKFRTLDGAYEYIAEMWAKIRRQVSERRYCGSQLWHSYLETPEGRVKLAYVLMAENVDSYGYSRTIDPRDLPPPTNRVIPLAMDHGIADALRFRHSDLQKMTETELAALPQYVLCHWFLIDGRIDPRRCQVVNLRDLKYGYIPPMENLRAEAYRDELNERERG